MTCKFGVRRFSAALVFCLEPGRNTAPRTQQEKTNAAEKRRTPKSARGGFTLLEMILALAVGLVLMWALYTMMGTQLMQTQAGRDSVEEATLVRSILARIANDVGGSLGPYDPKLVADSASAGSSNGAEATNAATTPQTTNSAVVFNHGIQCDGNQLSLTVSRVPREILGADKRRLEDSTLPKVSDLRRIVYWIEEGKGLAYQEVKRITAGDVGGTAAADESIKYIPEVKSLTFQFWDGSAWVADWDSSSPGADGETPIGPPAAIEIVLELKHRGKADEPESAEPRTYRQVISVPTGNNYSQMTP